MNGSRGNSLSPPVECININIIMLDQQHQPLNFTFLSASMHATAHQINTHESLHLGPNKAPLTYSHIKPHQMDVTSFLSILSPEDKHQMDRSASNLRCCFITHFIHRQGAGPSPPGGDFYSLTSVIEFTHAIQITIGNH